MKHQHEMGKLAELHEKAAVKERQEAFRKGLEEQLKSRHIKQKSVGQEATGLFGREEDVKKMKELETMKAKEIMDQNLKNLQHLQEQRKQKEKQERERELERVRKLKAEEELLGKLEAQHKKMQADEIMKTYREQEAEKRLEITKAKEAEKRRLQNGRVEVYDSEKERERVRNFVVAKNGNKRIVHGAFESPGKNQFG